MKCLTCAMYTVGGDYCNTCVYGRGDPEVVSWTAASGTVIKWTSAIEDNYIPDLRRIREAKKKGR